MISYVALLTSSINNRMGTWCSWPQRIMKNVVCFHHKIWHHGIVHSLYIDHRSIVDVPSPFSPYSRLYADLHFCSISEHEARYLFVKIPLSVVKFIKDFVQVTGRQQRSTLRCHFSTKYKPCSRKLLFVLAETMLSDKE